MDFEKKVDTNASSLFCFNFCPACIAVVANLLLPFQMLDKEELNIFRVISMFHKRGCCVIFRTVPLVVCTSVL